MASPYDTVDVSGLVVSKEDNIGIDPSLVRKGRNRLAVGTIDDDFGSPIVIALLEEGLPGDSIADEGKLPGDGYQGFTFYPH